VDFEADFLMGRYHPTLNAFYMKFNKAENHPELFQVYLRDIVVGFSKFFNDSMKNIRDLQNSFFEKAKVQDE
jgi:hypothetical protein